MKKIIVSALLMGLIGAASAADVTVYGKVSEYVERTKTGTDSAVTKVTDDLSRIGFKGTEDLGGGLKASFTIETSVTADAPGVTTLGNRTSLVGLQSGLGSVSLGRAIHTVTDTLNNFDAMGNLYGSSAGTIHNAQGSRIQNAAFVSATPVKGLTLNLQHGFSEIAGTSGVSAGSVRYDLGGMSATVARLTDNANNNESTVYGVRQSLGAMGTTVFAMYSQDKAAGVETKGKSIGATQALSGNLVAMASYGTKEGVKAYNAGLTYNLSKRTAVNVRYALENADVDANDVRKVGVGLQHLF